MCNPKTDDIKVYGKTLREQFEEVVAEYPHMRNVRSMIAFMIGYYGTKGAPCVDAGVFLLQLMNAVNDGLLTWEEVE